MEVVNSANYNFNVNEYKSKGAANKEIFDTVKTKDSGADERLLGIGFIKAPNSNMHYGMRAEYAEDFSVDNPVITVKVQKGCGEVEEYNIDIRNVNPQNATEIEMFALCNYADANGYGTGGTFGSWQTLNYYRDNAVHNGYFKMTNTVEHFKNVKQDWASMVSAMINDYMNAGLYKQALDGNKLLSVFSSGLNTNNSTYTLENRDISSVEDSKTDTDIIVKPDGSKVLVVTVGIGGMKTTTSLEIAKPMTEQSIE